MLRSALVLTLATGCMNVTLNEMVKKPSTHDSPATVIALGGFGDILIGSAGAGAHAMTQDTSSFSAWQEEFKDVALFYIVPIVAVDLVVALIRLGNRT
jgi:hypothetical protein